MADIIGINPSNVSRAVNSAKGKSKEKASNNKETDTDSGSSSEVKFA